MDSKTLLTQYTNAAKKIIYEAGRMSRFLKMMNSEPGAIQAVQVVMSVIEKAKPIPPEIRSLLKVNIYILMVDVAQAATDKKADPKIVGSVVGQLMRPEEDAAQQQPSGMIAQGA